jgi:hypothetical protein
MPFRPELVVVVAEVVARTRRTGVLERVCVLIDKDGMVELAEVQFGVVECLHAIPTPVLHPGTESAQLRSGQRDQLTRFMD